MAHLSSAKTFTVTGFEAPLLLLVNGALLAATVIISRFATGEGAPMLWFLTVVMAVAGLALLGMAVLTGRARTKGPEHGRARLLYSLGAGGFQAVTMAMVYLSVAHVGVGYISIAFAFPLLLTYLLALFLGMEKLALLRAAGVVVSLAGGLLIAISKLGAVSGTGTTLGWVLVASAVPLVLAGGNIYRTRYWPKGTPSMLLAALMLLMAALLVAPVAAMTEGVGSLTILVESDFLLGLMGLNIAAFALKFVAYFQLQKVAGPVYLSQIGFVSAAVGTPIAVLFMGETFPPSYAVAVVLIFAGAMLFQAQGMQRAKETRRVSA